MLECKTVMCFELRSSSALLSQQRAFLQGREMFHDSISFPACNVSVGREDLKLQVGT